VDNNKLSITIFAICENRRIREIATIPRLILEQSKTSRNRKEEGRRGARGARGREERREGDREQGEKKHNLSICFQSLI